MENYETNRELSDAELEAMLEPYSKKVKLFRSLALVPIAAIVVLMILLMTGKSDNLVCAIFFVLFLILIIVLVNIGAKYKQKYDELFMSQMGDEIEEIISASFGPRAKLGENGNPDEAVVVAGLKADLHTLTFQDTWNKSEMNSYRNGSWNGIDFEGFNVVLEKEERSADEDGGWDIRTIFDGMCIVCKKGVNISKEAAKARILEIGSYASEDVYIDEIEKRLYIAIAGRKFLTMDGNQTTHIEDLRNNLRASVEEIKIILNKIV